MFAGTVDLGNGTGLEILVFPLKGTRIPGRWDVNSGDFIICLIGHDRFCQFSPNTHVARFIDKLGLGTADASGLVDWLENNESFWRT
jgi:hypothetical protein